MNSLILVAHRTKCEFRFIGGLIEHTRKLISDEVPLRDGNDEPGLILASQYGAGELRLV